MAQFDVYRNRNARTRRHFPLLLDIQSDLLEQMDTRVVIPMMELGKPLKRSMRHLTPEVLFRGTRYRLMTPQLAGVSRPDLGEITGSLAEERPAIIAAIDFLITGI
ncbi:MAG: CcdB family protein [Proteobacteria bacterium]|nr:CcdB family protein [Pseudomonadota bacterium]